MNSASRRPRQMNRAYWDATADRYADEIFSVREHDTAGLIAERIARHAAPEGCAADLGCGIGNFTPLLAAAFGRVHACDLSDKLLARTRIACHGLDHVAFHQTDFACDPAPFAPVDFALCVNVLIMASLDVRLRAWRTVAGQVRRGGHLLLVVPSAESAHHTRFRRIEWCLRDGMDCAAAVQDSLPRTGSVRDLMQGIHPVAGVPTKHHFREELEALLADHQMEVLELTKLRYPWTTEFAAPPDWMAKPYPWNWLVVARRQ